jgi:hypothetical protein
MKRFVAYGVLAGSVVLTSCGDGRAVTNPEDDRLKWGWDKPHATSAPQTPSLSCSPSTVAFNGTVTCTLVGVPPADSPAWSFYGQQNVYVPGPANTSSWAGPVIISGTVVVAFTHNGTQDQVSAEVTVSRRTWSWYSSVGGSQGGLGVIDSCMSSSSSGLTASVNCTFSTTGALFFPRPSQLSSGNGYTAASVAGSGPNGGLWYVSQKTANMDLRTQVHRNYRSDGVTWSMVGNATVINGCAAAFPSNPTAPRNIHTVNNTCVYTPAFNAYVSCVWSHEAQHLSAATTSARIPANDAYALWEPTVAQTSSALQSNLFGAHNAANTRVFDDADAAHNAMTYYYPIFWSNVGGGWGSYIFTQRC